MFSPLPSLAPPRSQFASCFPSSGLDVVIHTWTGAKHVCRHLRQTEKNKSEKSGFFPFPLLVVCSVYPPPPPFPPSRFQPLPLCSKCINVSRDFLPVVLTLRSLCLRVNVLTPPCFSKKPSLPIKEDLIMLSSALQHEYTDTEVWKHSRGGGGHTRRREVGPC